MRPCSVHSIGFPSECYKSEDGSVLEYKTEMFGFFPGVCWVGGGVVCVFVLCCCVLLVVCV